MNNKGFTLVELITTFALSSVIIVLLLNIVIIIKDVYSNTSVKTELYINQSNLSHALNSKINGNLLKSHEICYDEAFCYTFNFADETNTKLIVTENKIKFGKFIYKLDKKTSVDMENLNLNNTEEFLNLIIPIKNELYPDIEFGINLVYMY